MSPVLQVIQLLVSIINAFFLGILIFIHLGEIKERSKIADKVEGVKEKLEEITNITETKLDRKFDYPLER